MSATDPRPWGGAGADGGDDAGETSPTTVATELPENQGPRLDVTTTPDRVLVAASMADPGRPVIPLGRDKKPDTRDLPPWDRRTGERHRNVWHTDPDEVLRTEALSDDLQRAAPGGWGVMCGEPDADGWCLVVIDTDSPEAEGRMSKLAERAGADKWWHTTMTTATPRAGGGWHRYGLTRRVVRGLGGRTHDGRGMDDVDVKGRGGYAVLPGSSHPSGGYYRDVTPPAGRALSGGSPLPTGQGTASVYGGVTTLAGRPLVEWSVIRPVPDALLDALGVQDHAGETAEPAVERGEPVERVAHATSDAEGYAARYVGVVRGVSTLTDRRNVGLIRDAPLAYRLAARMGKPWGEVTADLIDAMRSTGLPAAEVRRVLGNAQRMAREDPNRGMDDEGDRVADVPGSGDETGDGEHAEPKSAGGLLEIAPSVKVDGDREAWFWGSRDSLGRVRRFAQARRASPWATLAVVLARVLAATDYGTVLPPLVGGDGSLNLFCALVGRTSGGKGAAGNAGRDVLRVDTGHGKGDPFDTVQPGSGEGIAHVFAYREKRRGKPSRVVRHAWSVLLDARESESMAAVLQRNGGGTLAAELCKAFMGEHLGHATADPTRNVPVDAHTYRLAFLMGVQPSLAGWLTALTAGGLPGRFLWLPTLDAQRPAREDRPSEPSPILWRAPGGVRRVLQVPPEVVSAVEDHEDGKVAGTVAEIDGHRVFIREKVAAALTLLDDSGAEAVDLESWELAGHVLDVSTATRGWLLDTLAAERRTANVERGRAEGERSAVAAEAQASATEARVSRRVLALVREAGTEGVARGALRKRLRSTDRGEFDPALEGLVRAGLVRVEARAGQGQGTEWVTAL